MTRKEPMDKTLKRDRMRLRSAVVKAAMAYYEYELKPMKYQGGDWSPDISNDLEMERDKACAALAKSRSAK